MSLEPVVSLKINLMVGSVNCVWEATRYTEYGNGYLLIEPLAYLTRGGIVGPHPRSPGWSPAEAFEIAKKAAILANNASAVDAKLAAERRLRCG